MRGELEIKNNRQRYVFKIHTSRLKRAKWNLNLTLRESIENDELIAIGENTIVRFIDELCGRDSNDIYNEISDIRKYIKYLKKQEKNAKTRKEIVNLYENIENLLFIPEYLCIQVDSKKDFKKACEGVVINGLKFRRLIGTTGGIKSNTIIFVAEYNVNGIAIRDTLLDRIDNGRDKDKPLVPAKFEAYRALSCSASRIVTQPKGVIVVNDCITHFKSDYILLDDAKDGEPEFTDVHDEEIELNCSDGFGLISVDLAKKWSEDIGEDSLVSGFCIRNSFCKGMVFPFGYVDFGEKIAKSYIIKDAWGIDRDIRSAELILTTSMLKLWDSYSSMEDYLEKCKQNNYKFSVTKTCDTKERNSRELNYQFLQSYQLSDEDITELIAPTINDIRGIMGGDFYKTLLFLKGDSYDDIFINYDEHDYSEALMINKDVINDPCLRNRVMQMLSKKISQAKLGRIRVNGDFNVISGDPYSLCQSMFGIPVTGLLHSGEVFSQYWIKRNVNEVVCFRAPMSCHNNIRKVNVYHDENTDYWYRYMSNVLILNSWDTITMAENGADCDGDTFLTTNNPVLLKNTIDEPAIMCVQRKADKKVVTEDDLIQSNINGFGDHIGAITNRVTAMFEVRSKYLPNSEEYKVLSYRIMCGQLYQQNEIDRLKGVQAKPMPRYWYDISCAKKQDREHQESFKHKDIVAYKRPYFMNYRYSQQMSEYRTYIRNSKCQSIRTFDKDIDALLNTVSLSDKESEFLKWYYTKMPVGIGCCTSNLLCRAVESVLDAHKTIWKNSVGEFDYSIYKSSAEYSKSQLSKVKGMYEEYHNKWIDTVILNKREHRDTEAIMWKKVCLMKTAKHDMLSVCDEESLCNILLDLTYGSGHANPVVWDICGKQIIKNLLCKNKNVRIRIRRNDNGTIEYQGDMYECYEERSCLV